MKRWEETTVTTVNNLSQFAVFKAFWNEKEIRNIILKNPKISFEEFVEKATKINSEYNIKHLATEFETVKRSKVSFDEWNKIQKEKTKYKFLKYKTQEDERVRDEHVVLNNIIKPVDDLFWLDFYPPNGFNCRCYIEQLEQAEETEIENSIEFLNKAISKKDISPYFVNNVGETGIVFTDKHPYFNFRGLKKETKEKLIYIAKEVEKEFLERIKK